MRNFSEDTITQAVVDRIANAKDPRVKQVSEALVRHLHAFVREVEPTQREWEFAIDFLTKVGHMCTGSRQEFILLSDTLGVSMLVDAINHRLPGHATETTVLGPFYVGRPPELKLGADISHGESGPRLLVEGTVRTDDGKPLANAIVDTWHSDADGYYDVQKDDAADSLTLRARFRTDDEGRFWFHSIVPSFYPIPADGPVGQMLEAQGRHPYRPAHVHFMIAAPGYETLVTHVFIAGDKYLDSDVVFGVKDSLIRELEPAGQKDGAAFKLNYDFVLAKTPAKKSAA
jgi:hydroxyquinol 1,2-dioxygenase